MSRNDHLFPRYHVRPATGYMNDPNGPIMVGELTHLYFQYRHGVDHDLTVHWGHVTSPDLVHWQYHRPAIGPHPRLADRDGCWSGNTVLDPAGMVRAFYSGHVDGARPQQTLSAESADGGYSFGSPRPVIAGPPADERIRELRDPFVWREGSSWRMVIGAGTSTELAMLRLYASDDLDRWEYCGPLARMARTTAPGWDSGGMWECPQIIEDGAERIAVVGSWGAAEGVMNVLSFAVPATADGPDLEPSGVHLVDHGPNFYAASVLSRGADGPVMWGWVTEGRSEQWSQADNWSGMLSLPRVISSRPGGVLASHPLPALSSLRVDQAGVEVSHSLDGLGAQFEFLLEPGELPAGAQGVRLRFGAGECLEISVDHGGGVAIDRDRASNDFRADGGVVVIANPGGLPPDETGIRGFVDGSVLELFLPGGRVATTRFYPTRPPPWRLERVGGAGSSRLQVWELGRRSGA